MCLILGICVIYVCIGSSDHLVSSNTSRAPLARLCPPKPTARFFKAQPALTDAAQGLYSLSRQTFHREISWSLDAARFGVRLFLSLWNLAGTPAVWRLPRCLPNFRSIGKFLPRISRLRDFTRFGGKTFYRLVNRGSGFLHCLAGWPLPNLFSV